MKNYWLNNITHEELQKLYDEKLECMKLYMVEKIDEYLCTLTVREAKRLTGRVIFRRACPDIEIEDTEVE